MAAAALGIISFLIPHDYVDPNFPNDVRYVNFPAYFSDNIGSNYSSAAEVDLKTLLVLQKRILVLIKPTALGMTLLLLIQLLFLWCWPFYVCLVSTFFYFQFPENSQNPSPCFGTGDGNCNYNSVFAIICMSPPTPIVSFVSYAFNGL